MCPVPKDELIKDLETPEYQGIVRDALAKKEFIIRTKEEETTFRTNFEKDVEEKAIGPKLKAVHDQYDKDVEEASGLKRETNEKSYDFVKRAIKHVGSDSVNLKSEIDTLKKQIADGDKTGATKKALDDAEAKYKTALQEKDDLISKLQNETSSTKKQALLTSAYAGVRATFKKDLPPMFDKTERAILNEVMSSSVVADDGKLYVADEKGQILKDKSFNPVTVEQRLKEEFAAVISVQQQKGGTGSHNAASKDPNAESSKDSITAENFVMPEEIKNGPQLTDYMQSLGLKRGTPQYTEIWNKFRVQLEDGKNFKVPKALEPVKK
jgi:hypothetical protein